MDARESTAHEKAADYQKEYWKAQQKKLHSMADGYLYSYNCRSGRRVPTLLLADLGLNARLSAERSLFSSLSESSASSSNGPARGTLIRKTNKLVRFVTSVFTDSSSEIAAERFPFEMFLMAASTKPCKEMLSSYCTLFPLNAKKFEAFDSVYSFLSCDCVAASLPSRSRLNQI